MSRFIDTARLDSYIEEKVAEAVAAVLEAPAKEDPWFGSKTAAEYMDVSVQRVHDLVCEGKLARHGERGERLYFRRSELDAYMQTRGRS